MNQISYNVDIAICIDCTGSMSPIIDMAKKKAMSFSSDLKARMDEKGKGIDTLRVRTIAFRDFNVDGSASLSTTPFLTLPSQESEFSEFFKALKADGGGDEPENGLEALVIALNSEWTKTGDKQRHVTVVWTDASAHALESYTGTYPKDYPEMAPKHFDDLSDLWEGQFLSASPKRLIIFAPDSYPWTTIADHWSNTIMFPSKAGEGLDELSYQAILDAIVNSI